MEKWIYKLSTLLFIVTLVFDTWGQENLIYEKVQQEKARGMAFKEIPNAFKQTMEDKNRTGHFDNAEEVYFLEYDESFLLEPSGGAIFLLVPMKQKTLQLELVEVPASFYNYKVTTSEGEELPPDYSIRHYRGIVKDDPNSIASLRLAL